MENGTVEERLSEVEKLVKENNVILRKMRRGQIWASIMRAIYWLIILGVAAASYYYIQPYLENVLKLYGSLNDQISDFGSFFGNAGGLLWRRELPRLFRAWREVLKSL